MNDATAKLRTTWLTPICAVWESHSGAGSFTSVAKQAAGALGPLLATGHDPPTIAEHLEVYLTRTDPQFQSITRFAQTFEQWAPQQLVDPISGILTPAGASIVFGK